MSHVIRASIFASISVAASLVLAAPASKPREEKLTPPTTDQFELAVENMKQFGLAFHNFNDALGTLPTNVLGKDNKPLLSWRVQILPYMEEDQLYRKFRLNEPWDSEHNKKLIDLMPKIYSPIRVKADKGMTFYQGFTGSNGLLQPGKYSIANIPDGSSNTLMVVESAKPVIWTKPDDLEYSGKDIPALGGMFDGKFHAVMGDGSANRFRKGINSATLRLLIDPADGTPLPRDMGIDEDKK